VPREQIPNADQNAKNPTPYMNQMNTYTSSLDACQQRAQFNETAIPLTFPVSNPLSKGMHLGYLSLQDIDTSMTDKVSLSNEFVVDMAPKHTQRDLASDRKRKNQSGSRGRRNIAPSLQRYQNVRGATHPSLTLFRHVF
jgi:hypothetical protein